MVIPDTQCKPGQDFTFLKHIGEYIVDKQPDVIVHLGDHWDMPSLSSYDVGKKTFEGRRYKADIEAGNDAMAALLAPIEEYNKQQAKNKKKQYAPRKVFTTGNHEQRIIRAVNDDPKLDGTIGFQDLYLDDWEVYPFLVPTSIDDISVCHYYTTGLMGRPCTTASAQLAKKHMSCLSGHQQGLQIATGHRADGKRLTSVIAGSAYPTTEDYLGPQGNKHWRGILVLHDVCEGEFDLMPVSLSYLEKRSARRSNPT